MNFDVKRNLQFTELVKADGRLREFNFTRLKALTDPYFKVDVVDDRGNRILFEMKFISGEWRIPVKDLPHWIHENENTFRQFIEEELTHDRVISTVHELPKEEA
jgi:hypothetical protein